MSEPLKYTAAKIADYAHPAGIDANLPIAVVNYILDMAIEIESWPTKYALALGPDPNTVNVATLWSQSVLGSILLEIGLASTDISATNRKPNHSKERLLACCPANRPDWPQTVRCLRAHLSSDFARHLLAQG